MLCFCRVGDRLGNLVAELLLPRIARGDESAVPLCLDRYGGLVFSLARRMVGPDAEDLTQEIFVELWKSAGRYDPTQSAETTFVAMIARRKLIDHLRRNPRSRLPETLPDSLIARVEDGEAMVLKTEATARVEAALQQLRCEERDLIRMSILDGLTHEAIHQLTGIPLGTVKTQIRRGILRVRELLQVDEPERRPR
jgi:RNA polymerase sigma factor (sigma-70 family)